MAGRQEPIVSYARREYTRAALKNAPMRYVWFSEGRAGFLTYAVVVAVASLAASATLVFTLTVVGDAGFRKTLFFLCLAWAT